MIGPNDFDNDWYLKEKVFNHINEILNSKSRQIDDLYRKYQELNNKMNDLEFQLKKEEMLA